MAWTPQTPISVDMPGTAEWANSVQDNLVAVADGAIGAPKVNGVALDTFIPRITVNGTGGQGWVNLDRAKDLSFDVIRTGVTGTIQLRIRFSNNAGGTWGAWQSLGSVPVGPAAYRLFVNATTGAWWMGGGSGTGTGIDTGGILTVLSNANGVQFSVNAGTADLFQIWGYILGGVTP